MCAPISFSFSSVIFGLAFLVFAADFRNIRTIIFPFFFFFLFLFLSLLLSPHLYMPKSYMRAFEAALREGRVDIYIFSQMWSSWSTNAFNHREKAALKKIIRIFFFARFSSSFVCNIPSSSSFLQTAQQQQQQQRKSFIFFSLSLFSLRSSRQQALKKR